MSVYWPYPKQASDCVQRDLRYLVNPLARSSALTAFGTLQPAPSGLLNTIDPWTQSLTYMHVCMYIFEVTKTTSMHYTCIL